MSLVTSILERFNLGRAKIWMGRFQAYLNLIQFAMVAWLALQGHMNIYLILGGLFGACALMYFDIVHIYPREASYAFTKTAEWVNIEKDIAEIKTLLKTNHEQRTG
jgi:hypothetical protein